MVKFFKRTQMYELREKKEKKRKESPQYNNTVQHAVTTSSIMKLKEKKQYSNTVQHATSSIMELKEKKQYNNTVQHAVTTSSIMELKEKKEEEIEQRMTIEIENRILAKKIKLEKEKINFLVPQVVEQVKKNRFARMPMRMLNESRVKTMKNIAREWCCTKNLILLHYHASKMCWCYQGIDHDGLQWLKRFRSPCMDLF